MEHQWNTDGTLMRFSSTEQYCTTHILELMAGQRKLPHFMPEGHQVNCTLRDVGGPEGVMVGSDVEVKLDNGRLAEDMPTG